MPAPPQDDGADKGAVCARRRGAGTAGLSEVSLCSASPPFRASPGTKKPLLQNSLLRVALAAPLAGAEPPAELLLGALTGAWPLGGGVASGRGTSCQAPRCCVPARIQPGRTPPPPSETAAGRAGGAPRAPGGWFFFFFFLVKLWPREPPPIHFCTNQRARTDPERGHDASTPGRFLNAPCVT